MSYRVLNTKRGDKMSLVLSPGDNPKQKQTEKRTIPDRRRTADKKLLVFVERKIV